MSPSATATIAFAVTADPAATTPASWNTLCRTARRLASDGYEIRIGAGPGGEQIVAEHALTAGGHVTLVLPQSGYDETWVGQIRKWFPGRVTIEQEASEVDGGCASLLIGSAFLIVLGLGSYRSTGYHSVEPHPSPAHPTCDRSVVMAIDRAGKLGVEVYDVGEELSPSWLKEALDTAARDAEIEPRLTFRPQELDSTAGETPHPRSAGHGVRARRAAPSLLRRVSGSHRPSSPGPRFAG